MNPLLAGFATGLLIGQILYNIVTLVNCRRLTQCELNIKRLLAILS